MNQKRKVLGSLVSAAVMLTLIAGCGAKTVSETPAAGTQAPAQPKKRRQHRQTKVQLAAKSS
ncbi:hypothetical protein ACFQZT_33315 [Paenibacillus sp. GCM10027628]|uniref:hypothetical protein n=1 Tax=Paenibacillus sp. GCM10027628 TaxID=3273413 RepID=UPI0036382BE9